MVKKFFKSIKGVLFADPQLLYEEDKSLVNEPFYFQGNNRKAVLLVHGWTSTPYEVRRLGTYLNENGYTVLGPLLRGHGTTYKDLEGVGWKDWLENIEQAFLKLKEQHSKVFIGGTSIGSNLALILARKNPEISGLVLMATPYKLKIEKITVLLAKLMGLFKKYNKKFYPPTFGVSTTITRLISYQKYPIASALETFDLIKESRQELASIKQPCFIVQSSSDHIITKNSLDKIYSGISSKIKEKKYVRRAYHTFISDIKNGHIFEDILNFLDEN